MFKMDSIFHLGKKKWEKLDIYFPNALKFTKRLTCWTKLYKNSAAHIKIFIKE